MNPIEKLVGLVKSVKRDHITIRTIIAEEVGIPCIKVDTPNLQPGDRVEVTIKPIESEENVYMENSYTSKEELLKELNS